MANLLRKADRIESSVPSTFTRTIQTAPSIRSLKKPDDAAFNPWDLAQIWIESISKEESTRKQWEQMYGWMADLDAKGNFKPRQRILENFARVSTKIPSSRGHDYGWHLNSALGQEIKNLQTRFDNQYKKRLSTTILGYE